MYQIAICDDEKIFTDKLAHMIKQYSNAHHHVIDLHLFQQAADFIQSSLESYDIVFLDVRFGEISGIEVAKALRAKNENAILIFVSAFIEYAIMGYSVHASAYLLKHSVLYFYSIHFSNESIHHTDFSFRSQLPFSSTFGCP